MKAVVAKREDGFWIVEPYKHAPLVVDGENKYGEDIAGPFNSQQEAINYYMRMDYETY
jgi:hypothetical protein